MREKAGSRRRKESSGEKNAEAYGGEKERKTGYNGLFWR